MPACANESISRLWSGGSNANSSSPPSPISCSPPVKKPLFRASSSTFSLLDRRYVTPTPPPEPDDFLQKVFGWYPSVLFRFTKNLISTLLYLLWNQLVLFGPTLWLSAWLWLCWKCIQLPVCFLKWLITVTFTSSCERNRKKRTVVLSGGSSVQTLHLARNFYVAGARVVVIEIEGMFNLTWFSTAVEKFYIVPRPVGERAEAYVEAVKDIVSKEKAGYYIPVSATNSAYYDALVKPHLELMGCTVFCPGLKEVCVLDDTYELLRRCQAEGMSTPEFYPVTSPEDVYQLYEDNTLRSGRYIMMNIGPKGCRDRMKVLLPNVKREFKSPHIISAQKMWVIVRDYPGDHYVTCTTVKESQVVANVTCRVGDSKGKMTPVEHKEIEQWLQQFFQKLRFFRPISGHVSFRFVESSTISGSIVPLGCRVGISLPYICHTSVHPRIVWKPCRHFSRQASGPLICQSGRYWMSEAVISTLKSPTMESLSRLIGTVLDKREAVFAYWDPLPYCAYYHIQLPLKRILRFIQGRNGHGGYPVVAR